MVNRTTALTAPHEAWRGHAAMLLFSAIVAGSFAFGGLIANRIDPAALNAVRFAIASAVLGGILLAMGRVRREHFAAPWRYLLLGSAMAIYFITMFWGLKTATPVSASAVFTLTPIMSAGFGWLLMRQITTPRMALALALAGTGALWVIFRGDLGAMARFEVGRGEVIFFFGCIMHALYTPLVRYFSRGEPGLVFTFGVALATFLVVAVVAAPALLRTNWAALPPQVWAVVVYLAICASALTFFLLQFATLRLPSAKVMAYTFLTPVWVSILQGLLGIGWPDPVIYLGIGGVVLGLFLLLKA